MDLLMRNSSQDLRPCKEFTVDKRCQKRCYFKIYKPVLRSVPSDTGDIPKGQNLCSLEQSREIPALHGVLSQSKGDTKRLFPNEP